VTFRPFAAIRDESYRLYQNVPVEIADPGRD